ncbi:MAG: LptA/OstA family protein [Desulfobacterales bacterium]
MRKISTKIRWVICSTAFWMTALWLTVGAGGLPAAEIPETSDKNAPPAAVEITADKLVNHGDQNYAEFSGNVEAVQGNFSLRSDTLKIFYQNSPAAGTKVLSEADSIEKIEATGQVKIASDNRRAETQRAVYRLKEDVIELIGANSLITDGKNTLTGSKITWHRRTGDITVAGGEQKRVKAVFYSTKSLAPESPKSTGGAEKPPPQ